MEMIFSAICLIVGFILLFFFFCLSKLELYENSTSTIFECGFSSYFFSRFSFSIQFFMIALIFLFFDLELCCLMPFFQELFSDVKTISMIMLFVFLLFFGLLKEWKDSKLDWVT